MKGAFMSKDDPSIQWANDVGEKQERDWDDTVSYRAIMTRDQSFLQAEEIEVTEIKIRRPRAKEYFRVASIEPGDACILWDNREAWLVQPDIAMRIRGQIEFCQLFLACNEDGEVFLLPLRDPQMHEDKAGEESRRKAVMYAQKEWVRMEWSKKFRYKIFIPTNKELKGNPVWPSLSMADLVRTVKKDRWIDSLTHTLLLKLAETEVQSDDV